MTDASKQLEALWALSDEGLAEWWVKCVKYYGGTTYSHMVDEQDGISRVVITNQHALDLITASAERWLVERDIEIFRGNANRGGVSYEYYPDPESANRAWATESLTEALAHATPHCG